MFPPSSSKETYNPSCSGRVVCMFPCLHHVVVEQFACSYVFTLLTGGNSYPSADLIVGILTLGTSPCVLRHGPQYHFYCVFADGANGTLVMHPSVSTVHFGPPALHHSQLEQILVVSAAFKVCLLGPATSHTHVIFLTMISDHKVSLASD